MMRRLPRRPGIDPRLIMVESVSRHPVLPHEQTVRLIRRAQRGDTAARNQVLEGNLRLIFQFAGKGHAGDWEDAFQEGFLGLVVAIDRFNPSLGFRFSTYASAWIRQRIQLYRFKYSLAVTRGRGRVTTIVEPLEALLAADRQSDRLGDILLSRDPLPGDSLLAEEAGELQRAVVRDLERQLRRMDRRQASILRRRSRGESLVEIAAIHRISRQRALQLERQALENLAYLMGRPAPACSMARVPDEA